MKIRTTRDDIVDMILDCCDSYKESDRREHRSTEDWVSVIRYRLSEVEKAEQTCPPAGTIIELTHVAACAIAAIELHGGISMVLRREEED